MRRLIDDLLQDLHRVFESGVHEHIPVVYVGGSVGRGEHDEQSDLDIFLVVNDEKLTTTLGAMGELLSQLGEVVLLRGPVRTGKFANSFTALLKDCPMISVHVSQVSLFEPGMMSKARTLVVRDKNGGFDGKIKGAPTYAVSRALIEEDRFSAFWLRAISVAADLRKGNLWLALFHMSELHQELFAYMRCCHDRPPPGLNFDRSAKKIEVDFERNWNELALEILPEYSVDSVKECLSNCCQLIEALVNENELPARVIERRAEQSKQARKLIRNLIGTSYV